MREGANRTWLRVKALVRRRQLDRDLEDELAFHLAMRGGTPDARRRFGNVTLWKERTRELWTFAPLEAFAQDLRYASRLLRKSPVFASVAIVSLALGIGANTAIFSLMDAVLWKMLPVREPQQLVQLAYSSARGPATGFPYPVYEQLRDRSEVFSGMFAFSGESRWSLGAGGQADLVAGQLVSGTFHPVLGVTAQAGRTLTSEDDRTPGAHPVAVISEAYWTRRFGRDPSVVGMPITINGRPFTVVGVTPREFFGVAVGSRPDVTVPLAMDGAVSGRESNLENKGYGWLQIIARLKPGTTTVQGLAGTSVVYRQITDEIAARTTDPRQLKELRERTLELRPASQGLDRMRRRFSSPLSVLATMVGLTLLIACVNIANLLLAQASARRKEMAMRLAIGASRARLIRQLLTESLLLAVAGGTLGLLLARWGGSAILRLASGGPDPIPIDLPPDLRVLAFTALVAIGTGILFGLAPALRATRLGPGPIAVDGLLRGPERNRLSKALVVLQVGISLPLLVGAGLFVRTLQNLEGVDAGFDRDNLVVFSANPVLVGYSRERAGQFSMALVDRLEAIPEVRSATLSLFGLMEGNGWTTRATVPGFAPRSEQDSEVELNLVGPGFFETVGMPLAAGRSFAERDFRTSSGGSGVVVINETMAREYFTGQNPLGRVVAISGAQKEIVGVVKDAKSYGVRDTPTRKAYVPFPPGGPPFSGQIAFAARGSGDAGRLIARIREAARAADPTVPLYKMSTMNELIERSLSQERLIATLAGFFGVLALLLACVGLYGLMSYTVIRRTKEIGIRLALGARPGAVRRQVLRETLGLVGVGIALGVPAAAAGGRLVAGLLFGLSPQDPATLGTAAVVMTLVAVLAADLPARRASAVDPMAALRRE
jgi:predicted permease